MLTPEHTVFCKINLLPWRKLQREQKKKQCIQYVIGSVLLCSASWLLINFFFPTAKVRYTQASNVQPLSATSKASYMPRKVIAAKFPLKKLKFVGTLKIDTTIWGIIKQPDGQFVPVKIGNFLGKYAGRIISIQDRAIRVEAVRATTAGSRKKIIILIRGE